MGVSFVDYGCEFCSGLAIASTVRANDRINLYPAAPKGDLDGKVVWLAVIEAIKELRDHSAPDDPAKVSIGFEP